MLYSGKLISASIVLYKTPEQQLSKILDSIIHSNCIERIILVDNSPNRLESNLIREKNVEYIFTGKNVGYGAGHNIAINKIIDVSDFHFVLNPDICFEPMVIREMINYMRQELLIGQLMPRVIYPDGTLQYLCKLIPTPLDLIVRRFSPGVLASIFRKRLDNFELRFTNYCEVMSVPFLSGCFMLFRTSALKAVGLFDERYFMYGEDIDISRRMHTQFQTIFFPKVTVVHVHAQQSYRSIKATWIHIYNIIKYFNKWGWFFDAERRFLNAKVLRELKK